jgi:hypothetical protein
MYRQIGSLPRYAHSLLDDVLGKTGYPFIVEEWPALEFDSELKLGSAERPFHLLRYLRAYRDFFPHFLVNACYKILRTWDCPPEDRFQPASQEKRGLDREDFLELCEKIPPMPDEELLALSQFIAQGIVRQLLSFPVDLRVEKEIAEGLAEHRALQDAYLERQVADFLPTLNEEIRKFSPERLYRASTAMNIAFAEEAGVISGTVPDSQFRTHPSRPLAERLLDYLRSVQDGGAPGDRAVIDAWARELGMEGWFGWVPAPPP